MKKLLTLGLSLALAAALAVPSFAATASFGIGTPEEEAYTVDASACGTNEDGHFYDADMYIVYGFTFDAGDTSASVKFPLAADYVVSVSTDYNEDTNEGTWKVIDTQQLTEVGGAGWWTPHADAFDLSEYLAACANHKIYVKISDQTPADGNGPFLYFPATSGSFNVEFVSSSAPVNTDADTDPVAPPTGDAAFAAVAMMIVAAGALVIVKKKRA